MSNPNNQWWMIEFVVGVNREVPDRDPFHLSVHKSFTEEEVLKLARKKLREAGIKHARNLTAKHLADHITPSNYFPESDETKLGKALKEMYDLMNTITQNSQNAYNEMRKQNGDKTMHNVRALLAIHGYIGE